MAEDVPPQLKHLRQAGPIAVAHQGLTRREIALLDAPVADVHGSRRVLTIAEGREGKDQLNIGPQLRLVLFDNHDIIPALGHNRLRDVALGQERIHRDNPTFQHPVLSEGLDRGDLLAFVINGVLGQWHAYLVRQR